MPPCYSLVSVLSMWLTSKPGRCFQDLSTHSCSCSVYSGQVYLDRFAGHLHLAEVVVNLIERTMNSKQSSCCSAVNDVFDCAPVHFLI